MILASVGLYKQSHPELIVCPTCGRCRVDLEAAVARVRERCPDSPRPLKVAVMGCVVNGPGEAADAHVAVCGGKGSGVLYVDGRRVRTVAEADIVAAVVAEVERYGRRAEAQG